MWDSRHSPAGGIKNKVLVFYAVQAVYQAVLDHRLSPISGGIHPELIGRLFLETKQQSTP